jgi:hypothetical protein
MVFSSAGTDLLQHPQPHRWVLHHAPTSTGLGPPGLELRLHQHDQVGARLTHGDQSPQYSAKRDEAQVGDDQLGRFTDEVGGGGANIGSLDIDHARIGPEALVQLAITDIYSHNLLRSPLEQTVREAARGCTGIDAQALYDIDPECIKSGIELVATPTHEAGPVIQDLHTVAAIDQASRLVGEAPVYLDFVRVDEPSRLLSRVSETAADEFGVKAVSGDGAQATVPT